MQASTINLLEETYRMMFKNDIDLNIVVLKL
jgi:hypothetical protein